MTACDNGCGSSDTSASQTTTPSNLVSTNAVSRSLSDLHTPTWLALLGFNVGLRTLLFHPLNLAIARKRVTREERPPSVPSLIARAYRGEVNPNAASTTKGVRAVYRGLGAMIVGNLFGEIAYLHTLESVREMLETPTSSAHDTSKRRHDFTVDSYAVAVGGMAGDLVALLLVTPIAVVCNRQMTAGYGMSASNTYRSAWGTARDVFSLHQKPGEYSFFSRARRGIRGFYSGLSPGIAGIPSSGLWWALYSEVKAGLYTVTEPVLSKLECRDAYSEEGRQQRSLWQQNWLLSPTDNPVINALAGMIASSVTAVVFNPVDVVHTRLQALPPTKLNNVRNVPFARLRYILSDLIRAEGWRGLFKGTTANVAASVLDGVVFSLFFELSKLGSDREFLRQL